MQPLEKPKKKYDPKTGMWAHDKIGGKAPPPLTNAQPLGQPPADYQGNMNGTAPTPPAPSIMGDNTPPPGPVDQVKFQQMKVNEAVNAPIAHQSPLAQGLWWALQGIKEFTRPGSGNLEYLGQAKHDFRVSQEQNKLAPLIQQRNQDLEYRGNTAKISSLENQAKQDEINTTLAQNPGLATGIKAGRVMKEQITPELQQKIPGLKPYDYSQYDTEEINGQRVATPKLGYPNYTGTNAPKNLVNAPVKRKDDQGEYYTTGKEVEETNRQLEREKIQQSGKVNPAEKDSLELENKDQKATYDWETDESGRKANLSKVQTKLNSLRIEATKAANDLNKAQLDLANADTSSIFSDTKAQQDKVTAAQKRMQEIQDSIRDLESDEAKYKVSKPRPPKSLKPNSGGQRTLSRADIESIAKRNNMTPEQVMELYKKSGSTRYKIQ